VQAVVLALCGAALWGTGDFLGGLATRRLLVLIVLFWSQLAGLLGVAGWIAASGDARPGIPLLYAAAGGVAGAVGLGCLYRGMAVGAIGIVAPVSATAPIVPLAFSVARGDSPSGLQWAGVSLALAGVVLVSREPGAAQSRVAAGVGLALVAALGFGLFLVGLGEGAAESAAWATGAARLASVAAVTLALLWRTTLPRVPLRLAPQVAAVGACDTGANALIALAATTGSIGIVGVLSSLYPITTILLARAVLHERLGTGRVAGGLLALTGAALIAAA
jgi:drug/metabolite transporter (DMT)-like permease